MLEPPKDLAPLPRPPANLTRGLALLKWWHREHGLGFWLDARRPTQDETEWRPPLFLPWSVRSQRLQITASEALPYLTVRTIEKFGGKGSLWLTVHQDARGADFVVKQGNLPFGPCAVRGSIVDHDDGSEVVLRIGPGWLFTAYWAFFVLGIPASVLVSTVAHLQLPEAAVVGIVAPLLVTFYFGWERGSHDRVATAVLNLLRSVPRVRVGRDDASLTR